MIVVQIQEGTVLYLTKKSLTRCDDAGGSHGPQGLDLDSADEERITKMARSLFGRTFFHE